jgi:hypothetical protein
MDLTKIWELLKGLCKNADDLIPGATGKEKKAWVIDKVLELVNIGEMLIGIGAWANLPIVDGFEKFIIGLGVERAWTELQLPQD